MPGLVVLVALTGPMVGIIQTNIFAGAVEAAGDPGASLAVIAAIGLAAGWLAKIR